MTMKIKMTKQQAIKLYSFMINQYAYNDDVIEVEVTEGMIVKDTPYIPRPRSNVYYCIDSTTNKVIKEYDEGCAWSDTRYNSGNYYLTREEAEWVAKCNTYTTKLKDAAAKAWHDSGMVLNWKNYNQKKYHMMWEHDKDTRYITPALWMHHPRTIYFPSDVTCKQAYESILGSDLKKYLTTGV